MKDEAQAPEYDGMCLHGFRAVEGLTGKLAELLEKGKDMDDIEDVHKLRVLSRRLRAAMPVFRNCFDRDCYGRWMGQVRSVTKSLGMARDTDVQILALKDYLRHTRTKDTKLAVGQLLREREAHRLGLQKDVVKVLDSIQKSCMADEIKAACEEGLKTNPEGADLKCPRLYTEFMEHLALTHGKVVKLSESLGDEAACDSHHRLRIAVKRMRYTLELFNPVFDSKLEPDIRGLKRIQDLLGEMHDCDVWMDHVPKYLKGLRSWKPGKEKGAGRVNIGQISEGLDKFLDNRRRRRAELYRELNKLWQSELHQAFLRRLEDDLKHDLVLPGGHFSRIAVLSDVHGNLPALLEVIHDAERAGADLYLNCGDLVGYSPQDREVVDMLAAGRVLSVRGNFDLEMLAWRGKGKGTLDLGEAALRHSREMSTGRMRKALKKMPDQLLVKVGEKRIAVAHGSPISPDEKLEPGTPVERYRQIIKETAADIIVCGHTHEPMEKEVDGVLFLNPGSVGRPGGSDPRASYALLDIGTLKPEFRRIEYDVHSQANTIRKEGLPEHFAQMLLRGVSLDEVRRQEGGKRGWTKKGCAGLLDKVREAAKRYDPDPKHSEQVGTVSLQLFDALAKDYGLGERERYWLECAAMLHDIGWSVSVDGHHKHSLSLILNDQSLPFTIEERAVVGSIARYHRGKLPSGKHFHMRALTGKQRDAVAVLAGMLRLADGMDMTHSAAVERADVAPGKGLLTVTCHASRKSEPDLAKAKEKSDLLASATGMEVRVVWSAPRPVRKKPAPAGKGN